MSRDPSLIRGSRNEYNPPGRAVIPTPEEEALDAVRREHAKTGNWLLIALLLFAGSSLFSNEITEIMTVFAKRIFG